MLPWIEQAGALMFRTSISLQRNKWCNRMQFCNRLPIQTNRKMMNTTLLNANVQTLIDSFITHHLRP